MATAGQVSGRNFLSIPTVGFGFRRRKSDGPRELVVQSRRPCSRTQKWKWAVGSERPGEKSTVDVERLVEFLYEDLSHVFDEKGIDRTAYDEEVRFRDPITKVDNISGYLLNLVMLRAFFRPHIILHWVKKSGAYEITTRWSAVMKVILLPWKPELIVTGTSIMSINPETGKFCSHVDHWDSVQNNEYFSLEGLWDVLKQFRFYESPELESPEYEILKRTANYEVRKYAPFTFVVDETSTGDNHSAGFNRVASLVRDSKEETVKLIKLEGGIAAVIKFSGNPSEEMVQNKAKQLTNCLKKDCLKPINYINNNNNNDNPCLLARYNNSHTTWSFLMRNEVLIWLEDFSF